MFVCSNHFMLAKQSGENRKFVFWELDQFWLSLAIRSVLTPAGQVSFECRPGGMQLNYILVSRAACAECRNEQQHTRGLCINWSFHFTEILHCFRVKRRFQKQPLEASLHLAC